MCADLCSQAIQDDYKSGKSARFGKKKVLIWDPHDWGTEISLVEHARRANTRIACPDQVHGDLTAFPDAYTLFAAAEGDGGGGEAKGD